MRQRLGLSGGFVRGGGSYALAGEHVSGCEVRVRFRPGGVTWWDGMYLIFPRSIVHTTTVVVFWVLHG